MPGLGSVSTPGGQEHLSAMHDSKLSHRISFVVPALNEEAVIAGTVTDLLAASQGCFAEFEIILVDDGSTDGTGRIMDSLAAAHQGLSVLHNETNLGLGAAFKRGVDSARFEYVMLVCGDGSLPVPSLTTIFGAVGQADIVVPYHPNLKQIKTPLRFLISRCYTLLLNLMFGQNLHYFNGLSIHRTDLLRQIDLTSKGFAFQGEILIKLLKAGCSYVEVGVPTIDMTDNSSALNLRNLVDVMNTLIMLIYGVMTFDKDNLKDVDVAPQSSIPSNSKTILSE